MAKVLLVEDDNNLREIYEARLQAEGYDIVTAHDGEEALVVAKNETPDLIISDVMMPKISGFEMLDILRNTDGLKDVKIIMLTALGQSDDQQRADRLGANRYLVKSQVTLEDIVKVAQELLTEGDTLIPAAPDLTHAEPPVASEPVATTTTAQPAAAVLPESNVPVMTLATPPLDELTQATQPVDGTIVTNQPPELNAQLTTAEAANVEAQIEDFVQGASTEATLPGAQAAVAPQSTINPPAAPVTTEPGAAPVAITLPLQDTTVVAAPDLPMASATPDQTTSDSDDKLISDAIETFAKNTDGETTPLLAPSQAPVPGSSPTIVVAPGLSTPPAPETPGTPIDDIVTPESTTTPDPDAQAIVARKKVIEPLNSTAKPDLSALLAREAANEARPDTVIAPTAQPTDSTQPPSIDPNSIAL